MQYPWHEIDDAFDVFFDETVAVKMQDGKTTPLRSAVFLDGMADPLADGMMDTERQDLVFLFLKKDWPFIQTLKRGATITRCSTNQKYAVSEAKLDNILGWCVTAREK